MEKKITALFEVNVPKSAKTLAKFVSKDKCRPVFCGVMIDPAAGAMVATDTKKLQAYNVECVGEWSRNTQCYITAKVMRAIAGKTATVTMYGDVGEIECNGEVYPCDNVGKYPEWQRVIPDTAKHGKITFDKAGLKEFRKFVKSHIKSKYISIDIEGGASVAIVKAWDYNEYGDDTEFAERVEIALAELSQHEIFMHYLPISLYDCTDGCNGVIWVSPNYPAVFEGNAKHTICVFCPHNNFVNGIPAQASETPQISTEAAETVNVSADVENAKNEPIKHISEVLKEAEQNYQCVKSETLHTVRETDGKWHTYFMGDEIGIDLAYDQINHIPAARTAQAAEEVAEIRRYISRLNGNHIADADYYLAEMREGIKQAEAARRKKNADTKGGKAAERTNVGQNYSDTRVVKDEYHHRYKVTRHWLNGRVEAIEVWDLDHTSEPPQSPEAPQAAKHPTPPPILGRRHRKRARRGAQAAPGLRSAPGMCAGGCGVSRHVGRREAPVTSHRCFVGISGMVHGGSFYRSALPRAGPPYTENQVLPLQNNFD